MIENEPWLAGVVRWVDRQCSPLHPERPECYLEPNQEVIKSVDNFLQTDCYLQSLKFNQMDVHELGVVTTGLRSVFLANSDNAAFPRVQLEYVISQLQAQIDSLDRWERKCREINTSATAIFGIIAAIAVPPLVELLSVTVSFISSA